MRIALLLLALAFPGCHGGPRHEPSKQPAAMQPQLLDALEAELAAIRADPGESVGFGEKSYVPYEPNVAHGLITISDPEVTEMLRSELDGSDDRVYRLALLHVLGKRSDERVDDALIEALDDPELRATSAYLLGRPGFKGYPERPRDQDAVVAALRRHLADSGTFEDPFYRQRFRNQDFILAALVRLIGPGRFHFADPELADNIGYELPRFGDEDRAGLLAQVRRMG
jgi:HEAT repeat protein